METVEPRTLNINSEADLEIYIAELESNKKEFAREGRYDEADDLKYRIEDFKKNLREKKKKDLMIQHTQEMDNLEQAYNKEVEDYNLEWEVKFQDFENRSRLLEENLKEKHTKEMDELYSFLEHKLPKNVKYSKEYLALKNQEENLVKLQRFKEASVIQRKIEVQASTDTEKWNKDKNEKIKSQTVKTAQKHLIEKNSLKTKIEIEIEVMKKERDQGLHTIIHKYKNRKIDLDMQQKTERILTENENIFKAKTTTNPKFKVKKFMSMNQFVLNSLKKDSFEKSHLSNQEFNNDTKTTQVANE